MYLTRMGCCGLKEIQGLGDWHAPEAALDHLLKTHTRNFECGALIFTQAGGRKDRRGGGYGYNFAKYLTEHNLGEVAMLPVFKNPNTGRNIHTFIWIVNYKELRKWQ